MSCVDSANNSTVSGFALLQVPQTPALQQYLSDRYAIIGFQAYLWRVIVKADHNSMANSFKTRNAAGLLLPTALPNFTPPNMPAVNEMEKHEWVLNAMVFCREVNSFLTYLAELMTMIFKKYPKKLPSDKKVSYAFCIEHHLANDLIAALAEETVLELAHQNMTVMTEYFEKKLNVPLFTTPQELANATLCNDLRNIHTHNRGIINRLFVQRHSEYQDRLGTYAYVSGEEQRDMIGSLVYCARQLDLRAIKELKLETATADDPNSKSSAPDLAPDPQN